MARAVVGLLVLVLGQFGGSLRAAAEESVPPVEDVQISANREPEAVRVSMEFQGAKLDDVLKSFSKQAGINVIAVQEVGERPITLYLEDVAVLDALDQILASGNLIYERPAGSDIYIVKPKPEGAKGPLTITRVYRLKYARVSQSVLAKAAATFGARTPFESSLPSTGGTSGGTTGTTGGAAGLGGGSASKEGVGIDVVIKKLLTEQGEVVVDSRTNSLIVTDVPENFPRIEAALGALDVRTRQIMVDAELIETTLSKLKDLGVEWGTGSEGDLFSLLPATRTTRWPFQLAGELPAGTSASAVTTGKVQFGSMGTTSATAVLQALEQDTETKILARPKVLTLDNESALIRLTADEAIGFETASQATTGTQTSEPERTTTGVVLVVTPQVNEDGYITMLVEPTVTKTVSSKISPPSGQATPRDPKTRSARTLVRIRDGDTLVVGGLIDRSDEETMRKVPILSGIPVIGEAFKNKETSNSASELIVFVTPHLLEESSPQLASAREAPMGPREQEPAGPQARQQLMEETLNVLEKKP